MAGETEHPRSLPTQEGLMDEVSRKDSKSARRRRLQLSRLRAVIAADSDGPYKRVRNWRRSSCLEVDKANRLLPSCLSHGSASMIGRRREMEDAVTVAPGFASAAAGARGGILEGPPAYDFFGVYDGHCGASVAWACRDRLHVVLAEEVEALGGWPRGEVQWRGVMEASFSRVDGELVAAGQRAEGSTALVAIVGAELIVVANCGDSRAVLSRGGVAVPLSSDHKANRPDEMERVEAAGGRVINWDVYRVSGVLATSRSIGDHYLKPFVISEPEVTVTNRTEEDELLVMATDGLWDVISNEVACRVARQCLNGQLARKLPETVRECSAAEAAAILAELAYYRGSTDNISVVVVEL